MFPVRRYGLKEYLTISKIQIRTILPAQIMENCFTSVPSILGFPDVIKIKTRNSYHNTKFTQPGLYKTLSYKAKKNFFKKDVGDTPHYTRNAWVPWWQGRKTCQGTMFQSRRQWPLVGPNMSTKRPQGLFLWCKQLVMSFLEIFLVVTIFFIYYSFSFFLPWLN